MATLTEMRHDTVAALLRRPGLPPLETRILLQHALGWSRTELITRADEALSATVVTAFEALLKRRHDGEPIAQIVGYREFFGLRFDVTDAVLIPRPETELLVEMALTALDGATARLRAAAGAASCDSDPPPIPPVTLTRSLANPAGRLLDLGTGSGAIAIAVGALRAAVALVATDRSEAALAVAAANAQRLLEAGRAGGPLRLLSGNWYRALADEDADGVQFDVIVSNPPYIAALDPHLDSGDLRFEPRAALTDGADGLSAIRTIVGGAKRHLLPGGTLLLEHGYDQAAAVRQLFVAAGFNQVGSTRDLAGIERVTHGIAPN